MAFCSQLWIMDATFLDPAAAPPHLLKLLVGNNDSNSNRPCFPDQGRPVLFLFLSLPTSTILDEQARKVYTREQSRDGTLPRSRVSVRSLELLPVYACMHMHVHTTYVRAFVRRKEKKKKRGRLGRRS